MIKYVLFEFLHLATSGANTPVVENGISSSESQASALIS
jgi:hypothetical protein